MGYLQPIEDFRADQAALHELVASPATDLLVTIPGTPGRTILREVRLVGDHNAYREFATLRQVMGTWLPGRTTSGIRPVVYR